MKYDEALREWGARKLEAAGYGDVNRQSVIVEMEFNEGYACCGGRDPDCYCSFAESPSASVMIRGSSYNMRNARVEIDHWSFDFATILKEIVEAGGGTVTE